MSERVGGPLAGMSKGPSLKTQNNAAFFRFISQWAGEKVSLMVCACACACVLIGVSVCVCLYEREREREREREKVLEWVFCDEPHRNFLSLFNEAFLPFVVEALDLLLRLSDLTKISICTFQVFFVIPYIGIYFSILPPFSLYLYYPLSVFLLFWSIQSLYDLTMLNVVFLLCLSFILVIEHCFAPVILSFVVCRSHCFLLIPLPLYVKFLFLFLSNHSCAELNLFIANFVLFHPSSTWIVFLCFTSHLSSSQQLSLSLSSFLSFCSASFLSRWLASSQYFADWPRQGKKLLNPTDYST